MEPPRCPWPEFFQKWTELATKLLWFHADKLCKQIFLAFIGKIKIFLINHYILSIIQSKIFKSNYTNENILPSYLKPKSLNVFGRCCEYRVQVQIGIFPLHSNCVTMHLFVFESPTFWTKMSKLVYHPPNRGALFSWHQIFVRVIIFTVLCILHGL